MIPLRELKERKLPRPLGPRAREQLRLARAYTQRASLPVIPGRPEEATEAGRRAVALDPVSIATLNNVGEVYRERGRMGQPVWRNSSRDVLGALREAVHEVQNLLRAARSSSSSWSRRAVMVAGP